MIKELVMRACELYKDDTLAPSIVTSFVDGKWYVSVVRWLGPRRSMERRVVFGLTDPDLETAYIIAFKRLA